MPTRDEQRIQASKHLALMKGAFSSDTAASIDGARIYEDGDGRALELPEPPAEATATSVTTAFAPAAARNAHGKTVIVDPASFTRPGGAYEDGGFGPEQILCSESNLYPILCGLKSSYHDKNRGFARGQLFTDRALYIPDVVFSHEGAIRKADIIALPEPNRVRALENHRSERECDSCLTSRIETILRIAAANGCETLVVGAFGCGRLGYDPAFVIGCFKAWIDEHPGAIPAIIFAVPRMHADAFDAAFGAPKAVEPTPATQKPAEEDEDDFDFRSVDLPEGVTLR